MIEKAIKDYLQNHLGVPVRLEDEDNLGKEYILIEKTGSGEADHVKNATLAIQSFSTSLYETALLNERVKEAMEGIVELDDICRCDLNSDYNYTDTVKKRYRYQAVFDIVHY